MLFDSSQLGFAVGSPKAISQLIFQHLSERRGVWRPLTGPFSHGMELLEVSCKQFLIVNSKICNLTCKFARPADAKQVTAERVEAIVACVQQSIGRRKSQSDRSKRAEADDAAMSDRNSLSREPTSSMVTVGKVTRPIAPDCR
ncbi:hypothetical protein ACMX25_22115 [Caballeronia sp. 15715]|uniref:hypothetical protein n=1 Tax=Caballeronia sp. 15715 TaxID=3391030 RepID=UPI0039E22EB8